MFCVYAIFFLKKTRGKESMQLRGTLSAVYILSFLYIISFFLFYLFLHVYIVFFLDFVSNENNLKCHSTKPRVINIKRKAAPCKTSLYQPPAATMNQTIYKHQQRWHLKEEKIHLRAGGTRV
jgi:hypothetical protein